MNGRYLLIYILSAILIFFIWYRGFEIPKRMEMVSEYKMETLPPDTLISFHSDTTYLEREIMAVIVEMDSLPHYDVDYLMMEPIKLDTIVQLRTDTVIHYPPPRIEHYPIYVNQPPKGIMGYMNEILTLVIGIINIITFGYQMKDRKKPKEE
jgi:hypothetical protein